MKTLTVSTAQPYDILIGRGVLDESGARCRVALPDAGRIFLISDSHVSPLYAARVKGSLEAAGFAVALRTVEAGEASKCPAVLTALWEEMAAFGLSRTDAVAALGGGMVGDLAGFAAATILRGVDLIQIPTTLLAQVDSSVGGKVAVDLPAGKNLAGAFWQPRLVLMDPDTLDTLPESVFADGMAEVIKYGCIWDKDFFAFLQAHPSRQALREEIEQVLFTCCDIKRQTVEQDERDTGIRMLLNFGHTLAHGYEKEGGYRRWSHGQAVAAGMWAAGRMGCALGLCRREDIAPLPGLLASFSLPTAIPCAPETLSQALGVDKKGRGEDITMIFLSRIGKALPYTLPKAQALDLALQILEE